MIDINKIVKKLWRKKWKIVSNNDIWEIVDPDKKLETKNKVYKIIYTLKSMWIIINIKNGVYVVPDNWDEKLNEIDLVEKYYFPLVKKYITSTAWQEYFIKGKKALEIHMKNLSIPEKLIIINRNINKKIKIWNYDIVFKTIKWNIKGKSINIFSRLFSLTQKIDIEWTSLRISSIELALVESSIIEDSTEGIDIWLITKAIKKYSRFFDKEVFYTIWEMRFIMWFNRLKELSKPIDKYLYQTFLDVIKVNWWLFIWAGLRRDN